MHTAHSPRFSLQRGRSETISTQQLRIRNNMPATSGKCSILEYFSLRLSSKPPLSLPPILKKTLSELWKRLDRYSQRWPQNPLPRRTCARRYGRARGTRRSARSFYNSCFALDIGSGGGFGYHDYDGSSCRERRLAKASRSFRPVGVLSGQIHQGAWCSQHALTSK